GRDVLEGTVEIDGEAVPFDGHARSMDPGPHEIRVRAGGGVGAERGVLVEGERGRIVVVRLPARAEPVAREIALPPARPPPRVPARELPTWPYVLGAAGLASLAGAGYFYVKGFTDGGELVERCGSPA